MTVSSRGVATIRRRLPVGAESLSADTAHFRVWAPTRQRVDVTLENVRGEVMQTAPLDREEGGYFAGVIECSGEGTLYRYPTLASRGWHGLDGAVLSPTIFALRFFSPDSADRLLLVNLGAALEVDPAPEPLPRRRRPCSGS